MSARKPQASAGRARLAVLATADETAFRELVVEMLASKQRLDREAALEALVEHPLPRARDAARSLYFELDENGLKLDQGARQRMPILRYLLALADLRDIDIAIRASERVEILMGDDATYELRALGLTLLAKIAPDLFPFYAVEHLDDATRYDDEPAATAIRLLAATNNFVPLYQWLRGSGANSPNLLRAFDAFSDAPPPIVRRLVDASIESAIRRQDEALCIALAEAIVNTEMADSYPALAAMVSAKISDDLYAYLTVLLAGTNRAALLDVLEEQLRHGRRPKLVVEALSIRTTPEQEAILTRWREDR